MQLVRNLCAEAVRRLRVTEAAAAHALRSLRDDSVQQQHRTRFVHGCSFSMMQFTCCLRHDVAQHAPLTLTADALRTSFPLHFCRCSGCSG